MIEQIVKLLKKFTLSYDLKHGLLNEPPVYICTHLDTRNRYKNDKYKIPLDQPQCPIFKDNRCCGSCSLSHTCDHIVNCGCFGFAYASMGGTAERVYMNKASEYYPFGRIKNGEFDWEYYKLNKFKDSVESGKYIIIKRDDTEYIAEIKSNVRLDGTFRCFVSELNYYRRISYKDVYNIYSVYGNYESAKRYLSLSE